MTTTTDTKAEAELRDLAAWLDDVALALRKFSAAGTSAQVMREWMRAQAARTQGRAFLARLVLAPDAAGQAEHKARPFCPVTDETVYVILHATTGTYLHHEATAGRPAWTRETPLFRVFETENQAQAVRAGLPERSRKNALVVACERRQVPVLGKGPVQVAVCEPAPLAATADHIPGSCEFCPEGGGGCPVCRPRA
jgi:hypothetical protein